MTRRLRRAGRGAFRTAAFAGAITVLLGATSGRMSGQFVVAPERRWRTLATPHFTLHFPADLEAWARDVGGRIEDERRAVAALVGYAPDGPVTVIIDDPVADANGSAWPLLDEPAMVLWAHPPAPPSQIATNRSWGELVAIHEFAHLAHLTRPSRHRLDRALWRLLPVDVGPIARRAPRWVDEGYATYVEGQLTGSGRPFGIWRPAILRQRALAGRLPAYEELNAVGGFDRGAMAYLAGSAFLEWLAAREGDSSLVLLWRRLSAARRRSFDDAFAGIYGDPPAALYARFAAELTAQAFAVEASVTRRGVVGGTLVQRLRGMTGAPAVSPDGRRLALTIRPEDGGARVVVIAAAVSARDSLREDAVDASDRRRLLATDSADVPATRRYPRPRPAVASLRAFNGREHVSPRWFADGRRLLVTRNEPLANGLRRPDLFVWDTHTGAVHRVTHGAGVADGDPTRDGKAAVATRCAGGTCDLVRVDLVSGEIAVLAAGTVGSPYARPRLSPEGRRVAVSLQQRGVWRIAVLDLATGAVRVVGPDDGVSRYEPAWFPDGSALALVSEAGDIPNIERIALATGATTPLTRVVGAATAPEPATDSSLFFLSRSVDGLDLRLLRGITPLAAARDTVGRAGAADDRPRLVAGPFAPTPLAPSHPYGFGAVRARWLVGGAYAFEGWGTLLVVSGSDAVGRLGWTVRESLAPPRAWRGTALDVVIRRWVPTFRVQMVAARQRPWGQPSSPFASPDLNVDYATVLLTAETESATDAHPVLRGGVTGGSLAGSRATRGPRMFAFVTGGGTLQQGGFAWTVRERLSARGAVGRTGGADWRLGTASLTLTIGTPAAEVLADATYGEANSSAPPFERFVVGGLPSLLLDPALLPERLSCGALPLGVAGGRRLATYRVAPVIGSGMGVTPYFWAAAAGDQATSWHRVAGVEARGGLRPIPLLRLPAVAAAIGVGYSLDPPLRDELHGYAALSYRP